MNSDVRVDYKPYPSKADGMRKKLPPRQPTDGSGGRRSNGMRPPSQAPLQQKQSEKVRLPHPHTKNTHSSNRVNDIPSNTKVRLTNTHQANRKPAQGVHRSSQGIGPARGTDLGAQKAGTGRGAEAMPNRKKLVYKYGSGPKDTDNVHIPPKHISSSQSKKPQSQPKAKSVNKVKTTLEKKLRINKAPAPVNVQLGRILPGAKTVVAPKPKPKKPPSGLAAKFGAASVKKNKPQKATGKAPGRPASTPHHSIHPGQLARGTSSGNPPFPKRVVFGRSGPGAPSKFPQGRGPPQGRGRGVNMMVPRYGAQKKPLHAQFADLDQLYSDDDGFVVDDDDEEANESRTVLRKELKQIFKTHYNPEKWSKIDRQAGDVQVSSSLQITKEEIIAHHKALQEETAEAADDAAAVESSYEEDGDYEDENEDSFIDDA